MFLAQLSQIFLDVVFPVLFVALVGFILGRVTRIEARGLSALLIWGLTPIFIIYNLSRHDLPDISFMLLIAFMLLHTAALAAITYLPARLMGLRGNEFKVFLLTILIPNAGNYPIPVNEFAYGEAGKLVSTCVMIPYNALTMTLGVFLATGDRSAKESLKTIFKLPLVYALLLVGFMYAVGFNLQESFLGPGVKYISDAALPMNLLQLGVVLAAGKWLHPEKNGAHPESSRRLWGKIGAAVFIKLIIAPLVAIPILMLLGIHGQMFRTLMIHAAMPTAVYTAILSSFFGTDTRHVAATITISTLLSLPTVTLVLAWLAVAVPVP